MIGRQGVMEVLERVLEFSGAEQTQALLMSGRSALTRLAENVIHQNVAESEARLTVKAAFGRRIGTASSNDLTEHGLRRLTERAVSIARVSREDKQFRSFPRPVAAPYPAVESYAGRTAAFDEAQRAEAAGIYASTARSAGFTAAGSISVQVGEIGIANSLGVRAYAPQSRLETSTVFMSDDSAGHAADTAIDAGDVSFEALAATALAKCRDSRGAVAMPPGDYDVILEPDAVGALLMFLVRVGFHHVLYRAGGSFLSRKLGRRVLGDNITIWDDGTDPRGLPMPFDFEGTPKHKLVLFENGIFRNMVYDTYTAGLAGTKSTGHAIPYADFGAMPMNVFMAPGEKSLEEMIGTTKRGLLVTRFHYTNLVHPRRVLITGMTRDGTFLVEDGRIKAPVRNMRFTHSALDAMRNVDAVGNEATARRLGLAHLPAIRVRGFRFTGATEY